MKINLISYTSNTLETLYTAYRVCYSQKSVSEIWEEIESGKISKEQIKKFLKDRFKTGHTAPLRQLHFVFSVEGVSRVLTAQFNRHVVGVDRCEMSQRYVKIQDTPCIIPESLKNVDELGIATVNLSYLSYDKITDAEAIPQEDARYILPMGTESREQFSMSFEALQRFLDVRLCECAQWEIRDMAWKMYKIMRREFPLLSSLLGVKCWENRLGYCDEDLQRYNSCNWRTKRPHKAELMRDWRKNRKKVIDRLDKSAYI